MKRHGEVVLTVVFVTSLAVMLLLDQTTNPSWDAWLLVPLIVSAALLATRYGN